MKNTGEILRNAREKLGLSLVEVSMATKINTKILNALEAGDETHLPARTFLRGFIRSYANHLKLDADQVLQVYQEETGTISVKATSDAVSAAKDPSTPKTSLPDIEARSRTIKTFTIVGIFVLIILIIVVRNLVDKYEKERVVEAPAVTVPTLTAPSATPTPSESMEAAIQIPPVTPSPTAAVAVAIAPSPAPASSSAMPTPKPAPTLTTSPKPSPSPRPLPAAAPSRAAEVPVAVSSPTVTPTPKPSLSPKPSPSPVKEAESEIIIEALDKVTLKFKINDKETTEVTLQPDQVHTIKTKGVVSVDVTDGGAIDIIVNGRDRGVPGDLGKPKTFKLP